MAANSTPTTEDAARGAERRSAHDRAKQADPHGAAPGGEASEAEPKGTPNSDRHGTETAHARIERGA